ncbi:MAG: YIP1 family protein, partial [Thermodesulfobacteriota bacterium]
PLIYGVIAGIIGTFSGILWQWIFMAQYIPMVGPLSAIPLGFILIMVLIATPFLIAFSIFVGSAINHVCLMIVGGNKKGFKATFRAVSYAWSGYLFGIIPVVGSLIGSIYSLVLIIFGIREGHGISTGKATLAVFLPIIVGLALVLLAIFFPIFLGTTRFFRGVGV